MNDKAKIVTVKIAFKNIEPSDALRDYATEKLEACVKKFAHHDTEVHLVLRVEKIRQIAEVSFHNDGADFSNSETSDDMYKSIDMLINSLSTQLRRHKEKITKHQ